MDDPVVFMHGFPGGMISVVVDAVKKAAREAGVDPKAIAFAASTPVNMGWKIRDLIREVRREHEAMRTTPGGP
jgi:hypothetical protein